MGKQNKFQQLTNYLLKINEEVIILTFNEIENICGFKLKKSYRKYRQSWENNIHGNLYRSCISAGFKFGYVNMKAETVEFIKVEDAVEIEKKPKAFRGKIKNHQTEKITNESLEKAHQEVMSTINYGPEDRLITDCFVRFPENTDVTIVAMKIGLIDITNSTHFSQHKSKISAVKLAECIVRIKDIDERIKNGDPEVVNEIARSNGEINLFSFASKYCCYHNKNLYGKDDYSILDTVLKDHLPDYFDDITTSQIQKWQKSCDYKSYNDYLTRKLDELNITVEFRKRKLDHFVWSKNRKPDSNV